MVELEGVIWPVGVCDRFTEGVNVRVSERLREWLGISGSLLVAVREKESVSEGLGVRSGVMETEEHVAESDGVGGSVDEGVWERE